MYQIKFSRKELKKLLHDIDVIITKIRNASNSGCTDYFKTIFGEISEKESLKKMRAISDIVDFYNSMTLALKYKELSPVILSKVNDDCFNINSDIFEKMYSIKGDFK